MPLPPGMNACKELFGQATKVASQLLAWLDETSPANWLAARPTSGWISTRQSTLRLQRYLPLDEPLQPGSVRALAHADINLLTLLPAPEIAGLQLRTLAASGSISITVPAW